MKIVILAGGSGSRLWPLSRDTFPKQFLKIGSHLSLLQKTVLRFYTRPEDLLVVTNPDCFHLVQHQLASIDSALERRILVEPCRKNTGPAILLAVKYLTEIENISPEETVFVTPSDHAMNPENALNSLFPRVKTLTSEHYIVTFGIIPDRPETGFGYLHINGEQVLQFIEKPPLEKAKSFLKEGHYVWNSGIFAFTSNTLLNQIQHHSPTLKKGALLPYQELREIFPSFESISIDSALMEHSPNLACLSLEFNWSDLGSWDRVFDALEKDHNQNVKIGNIHDINTKNSLIYGGKKLISTLGLEDLIIVETDDALFLGKRGESEKVKELVETLKETLHPSTVRRPWGHYTVLEEGTHFKVKRIVVDPGQKLSLQLHYHRSEHWVVVSGTAKATLGTEEKILHENESVYVPKSTVHRLENCGKIPLEIIEVQAGEYTGEDDIVRFEDIYGRA